MRQMPVRIVSDGVVTRSVRDTAAFLREAEKIYRNLALPPIGDITRPGRQRLRVAVVTRSLTSDDRPPRSSSRPSRPPRCSRGWVTRSSRSSHRCPTPSPTTSCSTGRCCRSIRCAPVGSPSGPPGTGPGSTTSPSVWRGTARPTCTGFPGAIRPAAAARRRRRRSFYRRLGRRCSRPTLAGPTPRLGHLDPTNDFETVMGRLLEWVAFTPYQNATGDPAISLPLAPRRDGLAAGHDVRRPERAARPPCWSWRYELEAGPAVVPDPGRLSAGQADFTSALRRVYPCSSLAPLAQSAERLHGKEKVYGSIP